MTLTARTSGPTCITTPDRSNLTNIFLRASVRTRCIAWLLTLACLVSAQALLAATLATDKPDYVPGEYVTFTGTGFQAYETVKIDVYETSVDPFFDEGGVTANADSDGNFTN